MSESAACLPVAAIILAAGSATRMGRLKQLLPYRGRTLVQHSIDQARAAGFHPIVVVVGAEAEAVRAAIAAEPVEIVANQAWERGMGSSVSAGVQELQRSGAESAAVAILLPDQPLVTADHLTRMRKLLHSGNAQIVAAAYNGTLGAPALFHRSLFAALAALAPEVGARHLLRNSGAAVAEFELPEASMDLDTPEDFKALESISKVSS